MRFGPALQLILALTLACSAARADDPQAEFLGSYSWDLPQRWFGGLSGLELSADGTTMSAITDRGRFLSARINRTDDQIDAISMIRSFHLRGFDGSPLIGKIIDAEGLAIASDGTVYISFERIHRVSRYPDPASASQGLQRPQAIRDFPNNGGFEALAVDLSGTLFAVPEDVSDDDGNIPVFRWADGTWTQPYSLPSDGRFLPVGADFGPDGRFYLLERGFNLFGFRSRVRSWRLTEAGALDERDELQTETGVHGNLEGVSVWRDRGDRIRLTMIADDNFFFLQSTELVEYALAKRLAYSAATR